jgi:lysophospholipase L1-like esterase
MTGQLVLFQGDSVTDVGRDYSNPLDLGGGYPALIAAQLAARYPEKSLRFLNRGISGNRTSDLLQRWQADALDLTPQVFSLLIGINDTWRRYDYDLSMSAGEFESNYRALLRPLKARLILCEPFLLPVLPGQADWREDLDPKIQVVRKLAVEFGAHLLPLDGLFAQAATRRPAEFWLPDGVHPSAAGHGLIADAWIRAALEIGLLG